jgi:hypothetical protein
MKTLKALWKKRTEENCWTCDYAYYITYIDKETEQLVVQPRWTLQDVIDYLIKNKNNIVLQKVVLNKRVNDYYDFEEINIHELRDKLNCK